MAYVLTLTRLAALGALSRGAVRKRGYDASGSGLLSRTALQETGTQPVRAGWVRVTPPRWRAD